MKFLIALLISSSAYAECEIAPLKKKIIQEYQTNLPVSNSKGEIGHARAKNFVVSDYFIRMQNENYLIANFDLDIKWLSGKKQSVRTLVVATVNQETCQIEELKSEDRVARK